ncbi:MAG: aspartyl-tRNA(Asn)/glutamyl-tRNA (Gln) amidotransferase subunit A [Parcubacteria group bacterium LiPW_15]|nr:MAG: aspartyl-tRNA(Asn)/glutamyl-tRNA (Gln) amidotransferase subunit A [Parcubacteria group bacterium LiPW_15]
MEDLKDLTIKSFGEGLREKKFSAMEATLAYFENIKKMDPSLGAYLHLMEESAATQAEKIDLALQNGEELGPLAGVPMAIKDNILIKGHPATAASKMLKDYVASYDASVINNLKRSGAVFLGKTNMDEFAMGSSTENSAFRLTRNPRDMERVPGGSSGGSAAAVAGDLALAALGSDTGGSIRQPAALCGVVGLKSTYGTVSRSGLIAMASSLDQIGPITKTVSDAAQVFMAIQGSDPLDNTNAGIAYDPKEILEPSLEKVKKLRVGVPKEFMVDGLEDKVRSGIEQAVEKIKSLGVEVKTISLPNAKYALSTYYIIMPAEVSSNLARFDGIRYGARDDENKKQSLLDIYLSERGRGFGAETKRRIILGTFVLSSGYYDAYYEKAQRVRALMRKDLDEAFKEVDVIIGPTTPTTAFKIGEKTSDPLSMYLSDIFTIPANMAEIPAISIPVEKFKEGELPVGFQLMGRRFREADILSLGQYYEKLN